MKLPRGVTGFRHVDDPELPLVSPSVFRAACYAVARRYGYTVQVTDGHPDEPAVGNFHWAELTRRDRQVFVVCNAVSGHIAFASSLRKGEPLSARDEPALASAFAEAGWPVLTAAELAAPFDVSEHPDLASAERKQIEYWKPRTIGDVVFNWWD